MNKQELSKVDIRLGEWAGVVHFGLHFTQSLDACFKWLVTEGGYDDKRPLKFKLWVRIEMVDDMYICWASFPNSSGMKYGHSKESPALALCNAILKLIEEKK